MSRNLAQACTLCFTLTGLSHRAAAVPISFEATDNATVQVAGPRTGANGKNFLNVEGSNNAQFASFGVADFDFAMLDPPVTGTATGVTRATLMLAQANAAFSLEGPVSVYLTDATTVSIQPDNTGLNFSGMDGLQSIDSELLPATLLGSGTYTPMDNGTVDSFSLSFTGAALTSLLNAINNDTTLRLIITPDAPTTAATYAGFGHNMFAGPTLEFEATIGGGGFQAADFDENGVVNGADLNVNWKPDFGKLTAATHMNGDADTDQDVDGNDFLIWQRQLNVPAAVGVAASVPEPTAGTLAVAAAIAAACRRGRSREW